MRCQKFKIEEYDFISESNHIEGVYDDHSIIYAMNAWHYIRNKPSLTVKSILYCHKLLMHEHLADRPEYLGKFRTVPVYIGGRPGLDWRDIRLQMAFWIENMNKAKDEDIIKQLHVEYEKIHPFIDGNGRTGRMFLNWARLKNNIPLLVIKEKDRYSYYKWFK